MGSHNSRVALTPENTPNSAKLSASQEMARPEANVVSENVKSRYAGRTSKRDTGRNKQPAAGNTTP
jgi:hypothetical protein